MAEHCKERVHHPGTFSGSHCSRRAVKDGYCKQHHPDSVRARREASDARSREQSRRFRARQNVADAGREVIDAAEAFVDCTGSTASARNFAALCEAVANLRDAREEVRCLKT